MKRIRKKFRTIKPLLHNGIFRPSQDDLHHFPDKTAFALSRAWIQIPFMLAMTGTFQTPRLTFTINLPMVEIAIFFGDYAERCQALGRQMIKHKETSLRLVEVDLIADKVNRRIRQQRFTSFPAMPTPRAFFKHLFTPNKNHVTDTLQVAVTRG